MPSKKEVIKISDLTSNIKVCHNMKDFGNEQYFVKKAAAAKVSLEKSGLPKDLHLR
ncbi:hypothetical protein [Chitinophaga arvensicola]|uniref:Uncharacterized protein n=1 Tax=Chitinophaga arvensicola TaxID=29529 RepID=A0A1I0SBD9_9BACT|nr:hypothetical protein [Chitinophaga arvensicola]SEW53972.1 hypothetical protein SAMN04488122_5811 [Chitinophaga arvensicola]